MATPSYLGIDHIQMLCPPRGEDRARQYWSQTVGFAEVEKPSALKHRGGVWFRCGAQGLHVGVEEAFVPAVRAHAAFQLATSADMDSLIAALTNAGYDVVIADPPIAERRIKTHDPFGNLVEFVVGTTG